METPEEIKEPVFDIPENYFADFERRITAKIAEREKAGKRKTIRMYAVRIAAVAAVMTGVIFSVKVIDSSDTALSPEISYTQEETSYILASIQQEYTSEYTSANEKQTASLPVESETVSDIIQKNNMSVIPLDEGSSYAIDHSAVEQYITDNYNIMELATL